MCTIKCNMFTFDGTIELLLCKFQLKNISPHKNIRLEMDFRSMSQVFSWHLYIAQLNYGIPYIIV